MTIIKRCEKEVQGSWAYKQLQAATWLEHFVPRYCRRCLSTVEQHSDCPAAHTPSVDGSKKWLDGEHAADKVKIAALLQLIDRMKADVALYIHGYNTCAVECAHGERTVMTSKRIEYWANWEGKCRLVQLLHNHRTRTTGESLLQSLGWQLMDGVSTQLGKIDRDKVKHHSIKTAPAYNGRQKAIRIEKKTRTAEDPELIARAAVQKQKTREKQRHWYSARKQLLYEEVKGTDESREADGAASAGPVATKKRGRPKKKVPTAEDEDKEKCRPEDRVIEEWEKAKDSDRTERGLWYDYDVTGRGLC